MDETRGGRTVASSDRTVKPTGRIENWHLCSFAGGYWLEGNVHEDARGRFPDGAYFHTSGIVGDHADLKEGSVVQTVYSIYILGKQREAHATD